VNGKDFFSGDPKAATQQLSADMIDKVQVIDDYGDLANASGIKDGEPEKIINLQLKKDRNRGVFSRSVVGGGSHDRYQATTNLNVFNNEKQLSVFGGSNNNNTSTFNVDGGSVSAAGGNTGGRAFQVRIGGNNQSGIGGEEGIRTSNALGLNFRNDFKEKKGSIYGNYSYSTRNTDVQRDVASQNFFQNTKFLNHQLTESLEKLNRHRASLNLEWNIDSFNYIKFVPEFNARISDNRAFSAFDYVLNDADTTSVGTNNDRSTSNNPSFSGNLIYNRKFRKRGRNFSMNLNGGYNTTDGHSNKLNNTSTLLPFLLLDSLNQYVLTDNRSNNASVRFNYSEPIMKDRYLDLIYQYGKTSTSNNRATYLINNFGVQEFSDLLSNAFETDFFNQRIGANIRTVKKKYNYSLGVSAQPVNQIGYSITRDSAYSPIKRLNLLPAANFAYNFTRNKTLRFFYNGNARQPTFAQLQPVKDVSNPQYQVQGNPLLKPEQSHNLSLSFNNLNFLTGQTFFLGTNFNLTQNQIVNNTIRINNAGSQLTTYNNVNGNYTASGFYNFSKPWSNRTYILSINGTAVFNNNISFIDGQQNEGRNLLLSQGAKFEYNLKEWLELDLGARYGLNRVRYTLPGQQNVDYSSWVITNNSRIDIPGGWVFRHDLEYIINVGLSSSVNQNITLLNASFEKTILKKKNGIIRISGFDILNQNKSIARTVNGNNILDTRVNRLTQYFMLTFIYRFNKFAGQQSSGDGQPMNRPQRMGSMSF
ncbi:MAG: outer membrane beta-barrel protein, partial [bacterium]